MSKHTPAPWVAHGKSVFTSSDNSWGRNCIVADCTYQDGVASERLAEANARLIAAAPELLEALETLLSELDDMRSDGLFQNHPTFTTALQRRAIAKAKGES